MRDAKFEELLTDVLREEWRVEPLAGMEVRVMARMQVEKQPMRREGFILKPIWRMAAAFIVVFAIVAGVMARTGVRDKSKRLDAQPPSGASPIALVMNSGQEVLLKMPSHARRIKQRVQLANARRIRRLQPAVHLQIAAIEIAPLTVQPLQVASLVHEEMQRKGSVR